MTELATTLREHFGQLMAAGDDLQEASGKLEMAWTNQNTGESNDAYKSFAGVKSKWDTEYGDTLTLLNRVAAEVENSMGRALGADKKIGDGFVF
ncbi:hypothetical protein IU501_12385 [Nocardia otitidiscaviarum]|uniref:hypothetical protein n=1 Tax=Nocardia otitidiscaviarum TaxID=1823 RepID=UPI0004A78643|nr:hypothetical protein [Nocardia otitidiscaviarum]MBF6133795.1 hypothetical protein [Nocardia otitidiscaviarum]MBF6487823.1 hypothetical protein [Nocardia otitidiscaviarum]